MSYLDNIVFAILLGLGFGYFYLNIKKLVRNINLGIAVDRNDNPKERWSTMAMIALGQSKMVKRPVAGFFHIIVYVGFVIINIELLEIIIDGLLGTHRIFAFLGSIYDVLIALFGGFAGITAITSKFKGNILPGVAISTALMPPLCTAGYGIATFQISFFL
jgi:hypothetical protein